MFNTGKMVPIIKHDKSKTNGLSNIRPIIISDTLTNIFEKIVREDIDKTSQLSVSQFCFVKSGSKRNHAMYTLGEKIK